MVKNDNYVVDGMKERPDSAFGEDNSDIKSMLFIAPEL